MILIADIAIAILAIIIIYQDFKDRAISWMLIPLMLGCFLTKGILSSDNSFYIKNTLINVGIITIELIFVSIYFSIKNRKLTTIINSQLGLGDVLFLVALCAAFPTVNFVLFILASFVLAILGFVVSQFRKSTKNTKIPLAGFLSIMLIGFIALKYFTHGMSEFDSINLLLN